MKQRHMSDHSNRLVQLLLSASVLLFASGCSVVGISNVEEAAYTVVMKQDDFELRDYEPMVVVETIIDGDFEEAGDRAFRRLFDYISGNNVASSEIAMTAPVIADPATAGREISMTAPVVQEQVAEGWRYMFVLPAELTLDTAPKPLDEKVALAAMPGKKVAVIRYSGFWSEGSMQQKTAELNQWISANQLTPVSKPRWAGYNPPWTLPFLRRNEVMIDVE